MSKYSIILYTTSIHSGGEYPVERCWSSIADEAAATCYVSIKVASRLRPPFTWTQSMGLQVGRAKLLYERIKKDPKCCPFCQSLIVMPQPPPGKLPIN